MGEEAILQTKVIFVNLNMVCEEAIATKYRNLENKLVEWASWISLIPDTNV